MERPLSSDELMDMLAKREQEDMTPSEREAVRNMPLPVSKPSAEEIAAMKEARRQEYRDNRQRVIEHLKKRGLRPAAIAGIVGNIDVETGGSFDFQQRQTKSGDPRDPNTVEGGGYGLFQFDDPKSGEGHETWYRKYLEKTNKEDSTESQLDYFLDMINAGEDTQDPFYEFSSNLGARNAGTIKAYFEVNESPEEISDTITDRFENPGIQHSDRRRASARETFAELQTTDRADVDPENQNINQAAPIADVGEDVSSPEQEDKSFLDYVPIVRQFRKSGFFAEGGNVTMEKQMELFDDGGLMDEGGTVDPVSGNEVPPGSTQEEVRDDIPAQLSEGEFVIPADVVRYIGLGNLMQMRQEAKLGLKLMEEMGQMGNSEEATMPDDLPFDINDLDMEDEAEYNVGGFVPGTQQQQQLGISGFQQAAAPTTGVAQAPVQAASQQFVQPIARPQQAAVPTMQQYKPEEIPTFQQLIGTAPGQYDEFRTYRNEAGMTLQIPFKNGQPIYPIPEGYKYVDPEATKTEEVTTTPTTPQTATVTQQDDNEPPVDPAVTAMQRKRADIAKSLGLVHEGFGEGLSGTFGSGYKNPDMLGKYTGTGLIIGKDGVLIDPITMSIYEQSGGGILGGIKRFGDKTGGLDPTPYSDDFYKHLPPGLAEKIDNRNLEAKQTAWTNYIKEDNNKDGTPKTAAQKEDELITWITETYRDVSKFDTGDVSPEDMKAGLEAAKQRAKERAAASRPAYADILSERETRKASERAAVAKEKRDEEIRREAEALRQANAAAARKAAATQRRVQPDDTVTRTAPTSNDDNESPFESQTSYSIGSGGGSRTIGDDAGGGYEKGRGFFVDGGLASKKKPKPKKMKRGGLASKK